MLFPTQRPTNFPPNQMQANPMQRMPGNMMFPGQHAATPPTRSNPMQSIIGKFLQPQNVQQAALPTQSAGGLSNTLNNVQQVLKMVQSTAPVVQQYGPMVKNIPVMFKMLKAFKDTGDDEPKESIDSPTEQDNKNTEDNSGKDTEQTKPTISKTNDGQSKPKLFI